MSTASLIGVLVSIGYTWRKAGGEMRSYDASAAKEFQELAVSSAREIKELKAELAALKIENKILSQKVDDWTDWATRLSAQVVSLGAVPVPFKREDTKKP
jgi:hypothetical protein